MDHFCAVFRGKHATFADILQPLPVSGNAALQQQYESELVAYGATNHPDVFGLQNNGLDGRPVFPTNTNIPRPWQLV